MAQRFKRCATGIAVIGLLACALAVPPLATLPKPVLTVSNAAASTGAIVPGFDAVTYGANDDGSYPCTGSNNGVPGGCTPAPVSLPFTVNFYGHNYNSLYVNTNGNVTFGQPLSLFTPYPLNQNAVPIIAPFFADLDTRTGNAMTFGTGTVDGRQAFGANWPGVGCFNENTSVLDDFQVLLIDRSDTGPGNIDIEFNYDQIQWDSGQASGGDSACLNGVAARAGFASGVVDTSVYFELPGSGVAGALLDSGPNSLTTHSLVDTTGSPPQPGRYIFHFRAGQPTLPPAGDSKPGVQAWDAYYRDPANQSTWDAYCAAGNGLLDAQASHDLGMPVCYQNPSLITPTSYGTVNVYGPMCNRNPTSHNACPAPPDQLVAPYLQQWGPSDGNATDSGFQCVELAARYLWVNFGLGSYGSGGLQGTGDGEAFVTRFHAANPGIGVSRVYDGATTTDAGPLPEVGDVVSFSESSTFDSTDAGHVAIVTGVTSDQNGVVKVTITQQNVWFPALWFKPNAATHPTDTMTATYVSTLDGVRQYHISPPSWAPEFFEWLELPLNSASQSVGSAGGTVSLADGSASVSVPSASLAWQGTVTLTQLPTTALDALSAGLTLVGTPVFEAMPTLVSGASAQLTFQVDPSLVPTGASLGVFQDGVWTLLPTTQSGNTLTASITEGGDYAPLAYVQPSASPTPTPYPTSPPCTPANNCYFNTPAPSPTPSAAPKSTPTAGPTATPTPTPTPTATPTATSTPVVIPTPKPSGGGVAGATSKPRVTPPTTATTDSSSTGLPSSGIWLILLALAGLLASVVFVTPVSRVGPRRPR